MLHFIRFILSVFSQVSVRAANSLADPQTYPNLFPDLDWALKAEQIVMCVHQLWFVCGSHVRDVFNC